MTPLLATIILVILTPIAILGTVTLLLFGFGALVTKVPFIPVRRSVTDALPALLPLQPGSVFYDLGSGDGRIVTAMATLCPQALCIGAEVAPLPHLLAVLRGWSSGLKNVRFYFKNFNSLNLSNATHIFIYLLPSTMDALLPKLEAELRPGTRLVSADFRFAAKEPVSSHPVGTSFSKYTLYVYEF